MLYSDIEKNIFNDVYSLDRDGEAEFREDVLSYLQGGGEYFFNEDQSDIIYRAGWSEGHASGYYEVLAWIDRFANVADNVVNNA